MLFQKFIMKYKGLVLVSGILLVIVLGCPGLTSWDNSYDFTIRIDSVAFTPSWVNHTDTLKIAFWGTVGNTDCHSFSGFNISLKQDSAFITATGHKKDQYRLICNKADIKITGEICRVYPVSDGTFTVVVNQPDGTKLIRQIWIH